MWCRENNILDVNTSTCSIIEAQFDDCFEDILDYLRISLTLQAQIVLADQVIDLTATTGILKDLLDTRTKWCDLRSDLLSKVTRPVTDILHDLTNPTVLEQLGDLIQHCNDDYQVNCSCSYDIVNQLVNCIHIVNVVDSSDLLRPLFCHQLSLQSILGDSDSSKYLQADSPTSYITSEPGDQNPAPGCNSRVKRGLLLDGSRRMVSTNYAVSQQVPEAGENPSTTSSAGKIFMSVTALLLGLTLAF